MARKQQREQTTTVTNNAGWKAQAQSEFTRQFKDCSTRDIESAFRAAQNEINALEEARVAIQGELNENRKKATDVQNKIDALAALIESRR